MNKTIKIITILIILAVAGYYFFSYQADDEIINKNITEEEQEPKVEVTKNIFDLFQGKWIAVDDTNSVIEFQDEKKIDYYSDQVMFEGVFEIDETGEHITVNGGEEVFEYGIIELSEKNLSLMYLPRGNILKYTRIEE